MKKHQNIPFIVIFLVLNLFVNTSYATPLSDATDLTVLLRSARSVSVNPTTIADPSKFDVDSFMAKTRSIYKSEAKKNIDESNEILMQLLQSIETVIKNAKLGKYTNQWPEGKYANKFLPARFAREVSLEYKKITNGDATIHLTTSDSLLVNLENRALDWERIVIDDYFIGRRWAKDRVYYNYTDDGFVLLLQEHYTQDCLGCHGGEAGKSIHAKPVEGKLGEFAGAISVFIKRKFDF